MFDLAALCWQKSQDGWTGQQIADWLGWNPVQVTRYKQIRDLLHPYSWTEARFPKNQVREIDTEDDLGNQELPRGNWSERHFRALLKHLPYDGSRPAYRAQLRAVRAIIARFGEKDKRFGATQKTVTARWIAHDRTETHICARRSDLCVQKLAGCNSQKRAILIVNTYKVYGYGL